MSEHNRLKQLLDGMPVEFKHDAFVYYVMASHIQEWGRRIEIEVQVGRPDSSTTNHRYQIHQTTVRRLRETESNEGLKLREWNGKLALSNREVSKNGPEEPKSDDTVIVKIPEEYHGNLRYIADYWECSFEEAVRQAIVNASIRLAAKKG
jgi:hypothetical protein